MSEIITDLITPTEFFREKITSAVGKQNAELSPELEFYLVNLLCDFISCDKIDAKTGDIDIWETPMALIYQQALEAPKESQLKIFKSLGDTCLYMSGYFQEHFNRKVYDVDYFVGIGSYAYNSCSTIMRERQDSHICNTYQDLSGQFAQLVEIVAEVSDSLAGKKEVKNLLALYDRWSSNNSERLRKKLENLGITPISGTTGITQ